MKNPHLGSTFNEFLKEEGIHEAATAHALKHVQTAGSAAGKALKPPHPGRAIQAAAVALDMEAITVAVAIGISRADLMQIVKGKAEITPEMTPRLAAVLGGTAESWQKVQTDFDATRRRRRSQSTA